MKPHSPVSPAPADTFSAEQIVAESLQAGIACQETGRTDEAEALFQAILAYQPLHAAANHRMGTLLMALGRPADAFEHLTNACAAAPETGVHWISVAECLLSLGNAAEAIHVLETAMTAGLQAPEADALLARARATP